MSVDRVYKSTITDSFTTLEEMGGPGITTGHIRKHNGSEYILLYVGEASILDGMCVAMDETETTATTIHVEIGAAAKFPVAVNNTGGTLTENQYFWGFKAGQGYVKTTGTPALGAAIVPDADGEVKAAAAVTDQRIGFLLELGVDAQLKAAIISL